MAVGGTQLHGCARENVDYARGNQISVMQSPKFVYIADNGHDLRLWILLHDPNVPHRPWPHVPGGDNMAEASDYVFINGIRVCREGHKAGCGCPTTGSRFFFTDH